MSTSIISNLRGLGYDPSELVANVIDGGHHGVGALPDMFDTATPLVFPPCVIVVLTTPAMYARNPAMQRITKSMFESNAKSVTGIDVGYTSETAESQVGNDGQTIKAITQVKRAPIEPSLTWDEKKGNVVWRWLYTWLTDIQDPDGNYAMAGWDDADVPPWVNTSMSMSFMAIMTDQTGRSNSMIDAAYISNVMPQVTGELGMQKVTGTSEVRERSANFTGHLFHGAYTRAVGRQIIEHLRLDKVNLSRRALGSVTVDAATAITDAGLLNEIDSALQAQLANS